MPPVPDTSVGDDHAPRSRNSIRSIALPLEHGGWGFTLEPVLLGLLVAYSPAAWELSVAALAVSLAFTGCGTSPDRLTTEETVFDTDRRQSAGNAALAKSLREAKPLVDLNTGEQ